MRLISAIPDIGIVGIAKDSEFVGRVVGFFSFHFFIESDKAVFHLVLPILGVHLRFGCGGPMHSDASRVPL
jgi:hypothetical protein